MRNGLAKTNQGIQSTYLLFKIMFIYLFMAVLDFCCYAQVFSSCRESELLPSCSAWFLIVVSSLVVEHRL